MAQQSIIRTKMASALIGAVHKANEQGINCGKLGRLVLTVEAKGTGVKYQPRNKQSVRGAPKGEALINQLKG
jgi:hypothetical protein